MHLYDIDVGGVIYYVVANNQLEAITMALEMEEQSDAPEPPTVTCPISCTALTEKEAAERKIWDEDSGQTLTGNEWLHDSKVPHVIGCSEW